MSFAITDVVSFEIASNSRGQDHALNQNRHPAAPRALASRVDSSGRREECGRHIYIYIPEERISRRKNVYQSHKCKNTRAIRRVDLVDRVSRIGPTEETTGSRYATLIISARFASRLEQKRKHEG